MSFIPAVVTFFVTLVIVAPITWVVSSKAINKSNDEKIGNANERAREIIDEALKVAETKKKEALLEAKEESLKTKNEFCCSGSLEYRIFYPGVFPACVYFDTSTRTKSFETSVFPFFRQTRQ